MLTLEDMDADVGFPPSFSHKLSRSAIPRPEWRLLAKPDIERRDRE